MIFSTFPGKLVLAFSSLDTPRFLHPGRTFFGPEELVSPIFPVGANTVKTLPLRVEAAGKLNWSVKEATKMYSGWGIE